MPRVTPLIPPASIAIALGDGRRVALGAQIGRGSMATVYRGVFESGDRFRRSVAVKLFDVIASDEHDAVMGALTEAMRRLACVRHPNVARVEDFGLHGPAQPFAVVEIVEGHSLARLMDAYTRAHERMPLDLALFVGIEVADALAGARLATSDRGMRLGVVHGELSANDVLLSWHGEVKVSDFGVAAAARAASGVQSVRALAKRMRALAPEVARGRAGDARSDVFSLGVILREAMVGPRFPPTVSDTEAIAWARDGVVHQGLFEPKLPSTLSSILSRALEREASRRYPHAGALSYELRRVALAMGVGDGRAFLRGALSRAFGAERLDAEEATGELTLPPLRAPQSTISSFPPPPPPARPSGIAMVDRFKNLRGEGDAVLDDDDVFVADDDRITEVPPEDVKEDDDAGEGS